MSQTQTVKQTAGGNARQISYGEACADLQAKLDELHNEGHINLNLASTATIARRLAKELNANGWQAGRAFYVNLGQGTIKRTGARVRKGLLEVSMCGRDWQAVSLDAYFDDGSGNRICVSTRR